MIDSNLSLEEEIKFVRPSHLLASGKPFVHHEISGLHLSRIEMANYNVCRCTPIDQINRQRKVGR